MKQNIEEIGTQPNWIIDIKNIALKILNDE